jgi:beta-glucanase (GH16 family)
MMLIRKPWLVLFLLTVLVVSSFGATTAPIFAATLPVVDDFESGLPAGFDGGIAIGFNTFQDPNSSVAISIANVPPAPVPGAVDPNNVLQIDLNVVSFAGFTHSFENPAVDTWVTQDWSAYEGLSFWLYGNNSGVTMFVDVLDNRTPGSTRDDAERWSINIVDNFSGWQLIEIPFESLKRKEIGNGAPNDGLGLTEVHGWAFGTITTASPQTYYIDNASVYGVAPVRPLTVGFSAISFPVIEGGVATVTAKLSKPSDTAVSVDYATVPGLGVAVPDRDFTPTAGTLTFAPGETQQSFTVTTFDDNKHQGERGLQVELRNPSDGLGLGLPPVTRVTIRDDEPYDAALLDDFERYPYFWRANGRTRLSNPAIAAGSPDAIPGQGAYERVLAADNNRGVSGVKVGRAFPIGQDWSDSSGISFWYEGQGAGKNVEVKLTNNTSGLTDPSRWRLVWHDEFNSRAGAPPDPRYWGYEVGDGVAVGIPGWGNDELQYYTDSTANAATDGKGNLAITVRPADGSLRCYYGPCEYSSARLLSKNRFEVAYGWVEARVKVPAGAGYWPAFWMLGADIDRVGWPQAGEIDIMEYVGRLPNEIFGTIHGPGYSGGQSYGNIYDFGKPVYDDYHTFAVEWQPDRIVWYVDGIKYHEATPNDAFLQDKQWVYNHPFYMLLNVAVGGNFGGPVGADTVFPQSTLIDYVRLYQARPRIATFTAEFRDDFKGWKRISIPFTAFEGKDRTTLDLSAITSIRFETPAGARGPVRLDQIKLNCADTVTVSNTADSGPGSLRRAIGSVCLGGAVVLAPSLAGQTIALTSGPLILSKNINIDASSAPGVTISGGGAVRVLEVNAGATASVTGLTLADGYGWQLAGGVLNNGNLTLDRVIVRDNTMATDAGDFWQGGGGIYSGDGASLTLIDSTVANNTAQWSGGRIYSFFNAATTIVRSTISGNVSNDVGGAIRSLGNMTIANSTISGNTATGWHGGAIFQTDGDISIVNSTIAGNIAPDWAPSTLFIGQFGGGFVPTFTLTNTIISGNQWYACEKFASGVIGNVVSGGHNMVQDDSCNPAASDSIQTDAGLGGLSDNGGPTLTHALLAGSPAIDAGAAATCPATDQRGVARPQGAGCDIGAYEHEP